MNHGAAAAAAAMILNPTRPELRVAFVDAIVAASDEEREAVLDALETTYGPKVAALRIPIAAMLRARNHRPGERP